jgi:hypothetical protein
MFSCGCFCTDHLSESTTLYVFPCRTCRSHNNTCFLYIRYSVYSIVDDWISYRLTGNRSTGAEVCNVTVMWTYPFPFYVSLCHAWFISLLHMISCASHLLLFFFTQCEIWYRSFRIILKIKPDNKYITIMTTSYLNMVTELIPEMLCVYTVPDVPLIVEHVT